MMCDYVARTNWPNIKSNYFVNTIIIFNLSYYTNITISVTFVNHLTLCRAFLFFSPKYHPHKSCTIFHINLYIVNILTEVSNGTNKLNSLSSKSVLAFCEHHNNLQPLLLQEYSGYCYICESFDIVLCIPFLQSITRTSPVPSSASICMSLIFSRKFLTAPTSLTM
jgi:hypothetical protein